MGAFAEQPLRRGEWVGPYLGTLATPEETMARYNCTNVLSASLRADYLFRLDDERSIDAQNSTHFSRYFNHAQHGNLEVVVRAEEQRVDFYAARDIAAGEELTFDYGVRYWLWRGQPAAGSDTRNFSDPRFRELAVRETLTLTGDVEAELTLLHPPPVGTVLPLVPLTAVELQAALVLPEAESCAALLRCLDYFGAAPRSKEGVQAIRFGVGVEARQEPLLDARDNHAVLQEAATACIVQAILDPNDASGASGRDFAAWLAANGAELELIRRWRGRVPRFSSVQHDVTALAAYLLWKNPGAHLVSAPLTKAGCDALIATAARGCDEECLGDVVATLEQHAPREHVSDLLAILQLWYTLGDGCTVISHNPPKLAGAIPQHLRAIWDRVPLLVEFGFL
ncbi:hypothetical protein AB1Y20_009497 [Prymnesium parvum]|uniref:SET domain-containing protein n=1 Tax=Prymnesium parvum TaxID=97485 RepID=A0AB34K4C5_PRYPA